MYCVHYTTSVLYHITQNIVPLHSLCSRPHYPMHCVHYTTCVLYHIT